MAHAESPPTGGPPDSIDRADFVADLAEQIRVPVEALARLRSAGAQRVFVSLLIDERLEQMSARGIPLTTAGAVASALGVQLSVAIDALLAEGAAEGNLARRLRELAGEAQA